ncbi:MAG: transcription-repair coupling factor [Bacteroidota bacterium]|nr:transcription-repair coupling factor [Bacteroidota bacterium]
MGTKAPLLTYFGEPKQTDVIKTSLEKEQAKIQLTNLIGSSFALTASAVVRESNRPHLFIFRDKEAASYFVNDIENLLINEVFFFPASYRRAYQFGETDNANILLRIEVLNKLNHKRNPIIVTYSEALSEKVVSRKELKKHTITLKTADKIEVDDLEAMLLDLNFEKADFVIEAGQYSIRGGIVDIYSFADEYPFRLEFFDTDIESIRTFDINTQLSIGTENKITIIPNTEAKKSIKSQVSLLEYLPKNSVIWAKDITYTKGILDDYFERAKEEHKKLKESAIQHLSPEHLFTNAREFSHELESFSIIENNQQSFFKVDKKIEINTTSLTKINKQFDLLKEDFKKNQKEGLQNIILCSSDEQEKRFNAIFKHTGKKLGYKCILFSLHAGFIDYTNKQAIYTDHQIFDRHHKFKSKTKFTDKQAITIKQLASLEIGDFVTHIDHGIGRFEGLHKIKNDGKYQEVIKLTYKESDILYISIHSLHKITKFSGKEGLEPKVNQLGSSVWKKTKEKTKKKVKQIAFNLIQLYAKRKLKKGFSYTPDTYLQHELEASFMYEDTPDQSKATADIKADMENEMPMDRLICGDVGFGKTEVAIRAAFKAVADSKQVAIIVPTTILALQHYKTFTKRLKHLPCTVDYINRFKTLKEQKETLKKLARGEIDILIGTHKIVGKDIKFLDLGLMIIDEEQKFGVNIKDKLKLFKENIDTLTLSATPIPRTLQFSLLGARDLSVINTPPPNRQSIETTIIGMNQEKIRDAISYEMSRNGQVYFVHNRIENIKEVAGLLQRLCPDAKIKIGHGQMDGKKLEELMIDFMEGDFDILVSTTIIENGVDIPNTNTIIINNAQNFGLSDLHQMRGRVGRSNKKAFCYLISPPLHQLSEGSRKRLIALEQFSALGSGFKIAMRDLDIRGAGDLLGADQSGFINNIGFETYQKILNEGIEELKREKFQDLFKDEKEQFYVKDCKLDTDLEILIPDTYVSNISERLNLYKELNNFTNEEEVTAFIERLNDRFGSVPSEISNICNALRLRWLAKQIGFERIILKNDSMCSYFPSQEDSNYYNSDAFKLTLEFLKRNIANCKMKEHKGKLSIRVKNISSIQDALNICKEMTI